MVLFLEGKDGGGDRRQTLGKKRICVEDGKEVDLNNYN